LKQNFDSLKRKFKKHLEKLETELSDNPDFIKIGEAYGIKSVQLKTKQDLKNKLKDLINSDEGVLIDCIVEKEENVYPMIPAGTSVAQMVGKRGVLENE